MSPSDEALLPWTDGVPRHTHHWRVVGAEDVVLLLHGSESHSGWFAATATALTGAGLAAFSYDRKGWGASPGARGCLPSAAAALREVEYAGKYLSGHYRRVHLAGLSWGGLLAAAARAAMPLAFTSVTLIVPAIYPRRRPGLMTIARGLFTGGPVALGIEPEDFTRDPGQIAFVRADSLRNKSVDVAFLRATAVLAWSVRRHLHAERLPRTQMLLAADDRLIDTAKTRALAERRNLPYQVLAGTIHSLVLERPTEVAQQIISLATAKGVEHAS